MLTTDAYAYLDFDQPLCAWATYRGVLVSAPPQPGFLSVWATGLLRNRDPAFLRREMVLEMVRAARFPDRASRLRGMFCFPDRASANAAEAAAKEWGGGHFRSAYLAELHLGEVTSPRVRHDANWITHGAPDLTWASDYWSGCPYPNAEPIWEMILEGRFIVLDTELRNRAYKAVKDEFPDSLMTLEIARLAAWTGSDFGNISAFMLVKDGEAEVVYIQDWREANDPDFHEKIQRLIDSGHPVNRADMARHIAADSFGKMPDLRPYQFQVPLEAFSPVVGLSGTGESD